MRIRLRRRGVDHGWVEPAARATSWKDDEPVVLRRLVRPGAPSMKIIRGLRRGADLARLVSAPRGFRFTGISQNTEDPIEMHKLHVRADGVKRELYVKVNWLSTHPGDGSLRLRFSFGAEILDDWVRDPDAGGASLRLCEAMFPEARRVTAAASKVARVTGSRPSFMQPIIYANAPDGGALFHHDRVPGQAGVLFTQLAGSTAWFAVPQRVLDRHCRTHWGRPLGDGDKVERLINHAPSFTRRLAEDGWLFVLEPGDAVLLRCGSSPTWHSVFTAGQGPNLALSMGFSAGAGSSRRPSRSR